MSHQYKTHFNSVGEPIDAPFRVSDLIVIAFCLGVIVTFISGAIQ